MIPDQDNIKKDPATGQILYGHNPIHEKRRTEFQEFKKAVDALKMNTPFNLIGI